MKITVITLFPEMISCFLNESIVKRAKEKKLVEIQVVNLRDFATDSYGTVDDRPYGGGAGMVLRVDVLSAAIEEVKKSDKTPGKVVLTSPHGAVYSQKKAREYSALDHLILIAGHYEGVDARVRGYIDEEVSLGDFVMTGGEIPAAAIVDSVVRLLPGVLKKDSAVKNESFFEVDVEILKKAIGNNELLDNLIKKNIKKVKLLEYEQYTRPEIYKGQKVPAVLLSGHHAQITTWQLKNAFETTVNKRSDLLES